MRGTELGQCSQVTAARRRPAFLSLVCHTGLPGEGTRTQGKSVKEKGTQIMGERRQALMIGYHLPPNIGVLLKERQGEQGCPSCSGACTMATTKCTFLEKGSWSNPLALKEPCAHTLGNRFSMVGARALWLPCWVTWNKSLPFPARLSLLHSKSAACSVFHGERSFFWGNNGDGRCWLLFET